MEIVNIYGHLVDKSEIIIAMGNYNNIHGLLGYFPADNLLQIRSLPEIIMPSVVQLILTYEKPLSASNSDKIYFSLAVKDPRDPPSDQSTISSNRKSNKYINVNIEVEDDRKIACAMISSEKAFFTIDYSSIDKTPRSNLLAGGLYSLQTIFGEQTYIVSWKILGFSNGDLVIFLPTTWYENIRKDIISVGDINNSQKDNNLIIIPTSDVIEHHTSPSYTTSSNRHNTSFCQQKNGVMNLIESLNQLQFKGYTTQQWCETTPYVINCHDGNLCGECLGPCRDLNHICYPNTKSITDGSTENFICGYPNTEPNMVQSTMVSFADQPPPQTTGTTATWIAVAAVFILMIILVWGLTVKYYSRS